MQIHQMSVTYLPEQDRILMRVNTTEGEETRMWLTRRLMVGLWPLLSKLLTDHLLKLESAGASLAGANPELKKMLADFRKEEFLQHADFDTPYQEGQTRQPLGEEPLLVTDVDAAPGAVTTWYASVSNAARSFLNPVVLTLARLFEITRMRVSCASMPVRAMWRAAEPIVLNPFR